MADALDTALEALDRRMATGESPTAPGVTAAPAAAPSTPGAGLPPPPDPLGAALGHIDRRIAEDDAAVVKAKAFAATHSEVQPGRVADVIRLQAATGFDPELIHQDFDTIKKEVDQRTLEDALTQSPGLASVMRDAARGAAVKDDIANASQLEWWITGKWHVPRVKVPLMGGMVTVDLPGFPENDTGPAWARAFMDGLREREFNARAAAAWTGDTSPENLARLEALRGAQQRGGADYGADNVATQAFIGAFRNVAELGAEALVGIAGAKAGAATTLNPIGAVAGAYTAEVLFDFVDNVGATFMDLRDLKDGSGNRLIDDETARRYAFAASAGGSLVTGGLALKGIKMIPGVEKVMHRIARKSVVESLEDAAFAHSAQKFARQWAEGAVTGAAMMSVQAGMNQAALTVAEARATGQAVQWSNVMDATVEGFKQGFVEMSLLAAWGPGHAYLERRGNAQTAALDAARLQGATETVVASKLMKEHPELGEEAARAAARQQGAVTHAFADVGGWTAYWQEQGVDPAEAATKIVGDDGKAWTDAQESGQLAIPIEKWLSQVADKEHATALAQEVTTRKDALTPRQQVELGKLLEKARAVKEDGKDPVASELAAVEAEYYGQAVRSGRTAMESSALARLVRDAVAEMAATRGETPSAILQKYPLTIRGKEFKGRAAVVPAGAPQASPTPATGSILENLTPEAKAEAILVLDGKGTAEQGAARRRVAERGWLDSLTGLGNRAAYDDFASRPRGGVYVMVDVNSLTDINELGHDQGDVALRTLGTTLHQLSREQQGKGFRYGGDELVFHFATTAQAEAFEAKVDPMVRGLAPIANGKHKLSVSLGFGKDVLAADAAAIRAKDQALAAGRGGNEGKLRKKLAAQQAELAAAAPEARAKLEADIAETQRKLEVVGKAKGTPDLTRDAFVEWDRAGISDQPAGERTAVDEKLSELLAKVKDPSDGAVDLAARVAESILRKDGPEPGDEVALPPGQTELAQIERGEDGVAIRDEDGNYFPAWKKKMREWLEAQVNSKGKREYSAAQVDAQLAAIEGQIRIFGALGQVQIDLLPKGAKDPKAKKGPLRKNVDRIYKISFDASAMCVKRLEASATQAEIQKRIGRPLYAHERIALVALFKQAGKTAPCLYCYVESPRGKAAEFAAKAMSVVTGEVAIPKGYKKDARAAAEKARAEFKRLGLARADLDPNVLTDPKTANSKEGMRKVAEHPAIYGFLQQQVLYAKANAPKLYEEYRGQILDLDQELIAELNGYAGFRFFSTSDFQAEHVIDLVQAFWDLSLRKAKAHAYTKVVEFAEIFGKTGMKIQTSLFAQPGARIEETADGWRVVEKRAKGTTGIGAPKVLFEAKTEDHKGKTAEARKAKAELAAREFLNDHVPEGGFLEDNWQGMGWQDAQRLRAKHAHVGAVFVATSDAQVRWALDQPWIDYIIPFHYSGLESKYYQELGWEDFTSTQNEKRVKGLVRPAGERFEVVFYGKVVATADSKTAANQARIEHAKKVQAAADARRKAAGEELPAASVAQLDDGTYTVVVDGETVQTKAGEDRVFETREQAEKAAEKAGRLAVKKVRMHELGVAGGKSDAAMTRTYLKLAEERGIEPVFAKFADHPSFAKLKKDYARTDTKFDAVDARQIDMKAVAAQLKKVWDKETPREVADEDIAAKGERLFRAAGDDAGVVALNALEEGRDIEAAIMGGLDGDRISVGNIGAGVTELAQEDGPARKHDPRVGQDGRALAPFTEAWYAEVARQYRVSPSELPDLASPNKREIAAALSQVDLETAQGELIFQMSRKARKKNGGKLPEGYSTQEAAALKVLEAIWNIRESGSLDGIVRGTGLDAPAKRGVIRFQIPGSADAPLALDISLFANSNESTAAHEIGHWLGLVLGQLGSRTDANPKHQALYKVALDWMGYASHEERLAALREREAFERHRADGGTLKPEEEARRKAIEAKEEKISHGFEVYLSEGKTPSASLSGVFGMFKVWMRKVYRALEGGVAQAYEDRYGEKLELSDDVRRMFDRLLASEDATLQAETDGGGGDFAAVLKDLTPAEREELEKARAARRAAAEQELEKRLLDDDRKRLGEYFTEQRAQLREEVEAELDKSPVYRALKYLTMDPSAEAGVLAAALGEVPATLLDSNGKPWKLDRAELLGKYSPEFVRSLPPRMTVREGGVPADLVAEAFGFATGDEMVKALQATPGRAKTVEAEIQRRMEEQFGPALLQDPRGLGEAAVEAQHSTKGVDEILTRMRVLMRRLKPELGARYRAADPAVLALKAKQLIRDTPVGDISAAEHLRKERAQARKALELASKGKVDQAYDALETQLWHHVLWKEARDAEARVDSDMEFLRRFSTDKERAKLGKLEGGYLEKVDTLLDAVELREGVSRAEVERRREVLYAAGGNNPAAAAMLAWIEEQKVLNRDAVIPQRLIDNLDKIRHWKDISLDELDEIRDSVANIVHLARTKDRLLGAKDARAKLAVLEEMRDRAVETYGLDPTRVDRNTIAFRKRALKLVKKLEAGVIKPEELILALDGGREDGPFHKYLYQPISEAHARWQDLVNQVQKPMVEALAALPEETKLFLRDHRFTINGQVYTMEAAMAVALNWGNASNREKLVKGWSTSHALERQGIRLWQGEKTAQEFLAQLDGRPELWAMVQTMWTQLESLWPQASALEKAMTGLEPKKIPPLPFERTLADGTVMKLEGGYYPMVYDKRFSSQGARAAESIEQGNFSLFSPGYERSITPHGHLSARVESFAAPVELSMTGLFRHLTSATKDIAMREALLNSYELITDQRFRDLVQVTAGEDALKVLDKWVRDVANDQVTPDGGESIYLSVLNLSRRGMTASIFVANAAQALQNLAGVGNVLAKVDAGFLWQGVTEIASDRQAKIDWINEKSGEMRHRRTSFDRDIKEQLQRLMGQGSTFARAQEVGLWALQSTDMTVAYPTWLAAYRQALAGKVESVAAGDDAAAVKHADSTVRRALGSGSTKDLAALMRSPQGKMVTMFYGFANAQLNQVIGAVSAAGVEARDGQRYKALRRLTRVYFSVVGGAILAELLVGRGASDYDDDGEVTAADWSKWIAMRAVFAPATLVPLLGQVVRSAESGRSSSMLAYERVADDLAKVGRQTVNLGRAVIDEDDVVGELGNLGAAVGKASLDFLPGGSQVRTTLGYWTDENRNKRAGVAEKVFGTTLGKPREGRLNQALFGDGT